jgi:hypothetical protein
MFLVVYTWMSTGCHTLVVPDKCHTYLCIHRDFAPPHHPVPLPMDFSATFCKLPLSTSVDPLSKCSLVSLDWILTSGIPAPQSLVAGVLTLPSGDGVCSMNVKLSISTSLPYDLVLGRDWLFFCHETLPHTSFRLSSVSVTLVSSQ